MATVTNPAPAEPSTFQTVVTTATHVVLAPFVWTFKTVKGVIALIFSVLGVACKLVDGTVRFLLNGTTYVVDFPLGYVLPLSQGMCDGMRALVPGAQTTNQTFVNQTDRPISTLCFTLYDGSLMFVAILGKELCRLFPARPVVDPTPIGLHRTTFTWKDIDAEMRENVTDNELAHDDPFSMTRDEWDRGYRCVKQEDSNVSMNGRELCRWKQKWKQIHAEKSARRCLLSMGNMGEEMKKCVTPAVEPE